MRIAIGNDHVGLDLKHVVVEELEKRNIEIIDCGTNSSESTDYPLYAEKVGHLVASKVADLGIIMCGTGVGISITANKIRGIRAVVCSEPYSALLSRQHNDTNVLSLGSRVLGSELARMIINAWLDGEFEGGRHARRVELIRDIENNEH